MLKDLLLKKYNFIKSDDVTPTWHLVKLTVDEFCDKLTWFHENMIVIS